MSHPRGDMAKTGEKILLIRLKSIGDILFTLPSVHLLREAFPGAEITFLVSREHAPLLAGFQDVDNVLALDRARFRGLHPGKMVAETLSLLRRLRRGKFSLTVDFQGYGETAWLTWWSGGAQRWAFTERATRKWAYHRSLRPDYRVHAAERNLGLLHQCGVRPGPIRNDFVLPDEPLAEARRFFLAQGLDPDRPVLFIQPFTSSPPKNWPLERYLEVARHWLSCGLQVLFGGGPPERSALEPAQAAGFAVSAGSPLLVTAGLMKLSTLVLGGDTGLLHVAVAMGRRVIMLMGGAGPGSPHPFQHPEWALVPQQGQALSCVTTQEVITACERALAELGVVR